MKQQLISFICVALALGGCGGSDSKSKSSSSSSMAISSTPASSMGAMSSVMMSSSVMSSSEMASSSMAAMMELKYSVKVTNLTAAQPLSPLTYTLHHTGFMPFTIGMPASVGVEMIAESGDASAYITEAKANTAVLIANTAMGMTMPGEYKSFTLSATVPTDHTEKLYFSVLSMLVNTNDAITGVNAVALNSLAIGESWTLDTLSYDAGTENNTELQSTIPGPAAGGEGFNALRDDMMDQVTMHPGVITQDDGKTDSVLTQLHRWDNPVARITITRLAP